MSDHEALADGIDKAFAPRNGTKRRTPRTIRFSDSEWEMIDRMAIKQGVSSADLVRQTLVAMTNGKLPAWFETAPTTHLPAEIRIQIEQMYRGMYILATLKRDEMRREGRQEELNLVHEASIKTQAAILEIVSGH